MFAKLNLLKDKPLNLGESAWERTLKKAASNDAKPIWLTQVNSNPSPRGYSPRSLSPRFLSPPRQSPRFGSLEVSPKSEKEKEREGREKIGKDKDKDKKKEKDKDKKKAKVKGLREQRRYD